MSVVLSIATSGLVAAARRLEVSARNVANALSSGPSPDADPAIKASFPAAYNALRVDQVEAARGRTPPLGRRQAHRTKTALEAKRTGKCSLKKKNTPPPARHDEQSGRNK